MSAMGAQLATPRQGSDGVGAGVGGVLFEERKGGVRDAYGAHTSFACSLPPASAVPSAVPPVVGVAAPCRVHGSPACRHSRHDLDESDHES